MSADVAEILATTGAGSARERSSDFDTGSTPVPKCLRMRCAGLVYLATAPRDPGGVPWSQMMRPKGERVTRSQASANEPVTPSAATTSALTSAGTAIGRNATISPIRTTP